MRLEFICNSPLWQKSWGIEICTYICPCVKIFIVKYVGTFIKWKIEKKSNLVQESDFFVIGWKMKHYLWIINITVKPTKWRFNNRSSIVIFVQNMKNVFQFRFSNQFFFVSKCSVCIKGTIVCNCKIIGFWNEDVFFSENTIHSKFP